MDNDFHKLVLALSVPLVSSEILHDLASFLKPQDNESFAEFVLQSYQSLLILGKWSWKLLSDDLLQWINEPMYIEFFCDLTLFNRSLIFDCDSIDNDSKIALLLPESIDQINRVFKHIEQMHEDNSPYLVIINHVLDNHSFFLYDHLQYCKLPIVDYIGEYLVRNYIMNKPFKTYLWQLQQPQLVQINITAKLLFYIKTCSFYFYIYLAIKFHNFFYTAEEMVRYLGDDYLRIIHTHVPNIAQWNEDFLACITHLISLVGRCCWWGGDTALATKILLPTEQMACEYVQDLISTIAYVPFHAKIRNQRCNDETALMESAFMTLYGTVETQNVNWMFRSNASYQRALLDVAETRTNDIICLTAYAVLSVVLADEQVKELKMEKHVILFLFNVLEKAREDPLKMYKYVPLMSLLQGILNVSKNDSVQQKVAEMKRIPYFIEMCDDYPIVYDILWALSFNQDIQQQLRSNTSFMLKLAGLAKEGGDSKTRKIIHGLLWNLESQTETHSISQSHDEETFDLMISYSHKNKDLCKQLYDELVKVGYRVWIDFDQMHGNIMDAMAQAIEQAQTVIICLSEDYRKSNYCRAEAHYAFQRQRKIIPVLLQKHYKPDGWLLFLIGQLLYVDFTKHEFGKAITMLLTELSADSSVVVTSTVIVDQPSVVSEISSTETMSPNILLWSANDVQTWLTHHSLSQMTRLLIGCDGRSLVYLNRFMKISDTKQIVKLLQSDAHRRLGEDVSLIELSCFRSLMDERQRLAASSIAAKSHQNSSANDYIDTSVTNS